MPRTTPLADALQAARARQRHTIDAVWQQGIDGSSTPVCAYCLEPLEQHTEPEPQPTLWALA